jgi:hypothetical protein
MTHPLEDWNKILLNCCEFLKHIAFYLNETQKCIPNLNWTSTNSDFLHYCYTLISGNTQELTIDRIRRYFKNTKKGVFKVQVCTIRDNACFNDYLIPLQNIDILLYSENKNCSDKSVILTSTVHKYILQCTDISQIFFSLNCISSDKSHRPIIQHIGGVREEMSNEVCLLYEHGYICMFDYMPVSGVTWNGYLLIFLEIFFHQKRFHLSPGAFMLILIKSNF